MKNTARVLQLTGMTYGAKFVETLQNCRNGAHAVESHENYTTIVLQCKMLSVYSNMNYDKTVN